MAISRANIGKEIKMVGSKKVKKYKKGKQVGFFGRDKTKKPWGTPKIQKKKEGGMILDAKFVASFYD